MSGPENGPETGPLYDTNFWRKGVEEVREVLAQPWVNSVEEGKKYVVKRADSGNETQL